MEHNFTPEQICEFGQRMAAAKLITTYAPHSHSHNINLLFPQTPAQFRWLRKEYGTTLNLCIIYTCDEVAAVVPELKPYLKATRSGRFCRIDLTL